MSWENDHTNLALALGGGRTPMRAQVRDPAAVRMALLAAIRALLQQRRGGTIFVPHVDGDQLWIDVRSASLHIPPEIELVLAPGVVLVPLRDAGSVENRLEIEGVLRAPLHTVFATQGWFERQEPVEASRHTVAEVGLTSRRLEYVCPEWWGAADPRDSTRLGDDEALAAALAAATTGRWRIDDGGARYVMRSLPVELRGAYTLAAPLEITTAMATGGVELRGAPGGDEAPTIRCTPRFPAGSAMLDVLLEAEAVTLEDLRLDGAGRAGACVAMVSAPTDPRGGVGDRKHLLLRCAFQGARDTLVRFEDVRAHGAMASDPFALPSESLRVEHCRFSTSRDDGYNDTALSLAAPPSVTIDVRGSTFVGEAMAMVVARSCGLSLANCHFRNDLAPTRIGADTPEEALHLRGPEGGLDIYLTGAFGEPMGVLYAQDCRSSSVQFLATERGLLGAPTGCTVVGLHHTHSALVWRGRPSLREAYEREWSFPDVIEPTPTLPPAKTTKATAGVLLPEVSAIFLDTQPPKIGPAQRFIVTENGDKLPAYDSGTAGTTTGRDDLAGRVVAPIHWRLPCNLTLTGCRFDRPPGPPRAAVLAFGRDSAIIDLGIVSSLDRRGRLVGVADGAQLLVLEARDVPTP